MTLIKKGGILSFGKIGLASIQFILLPLYTKILTVEQYGMLEMFTIFSSIISLLFLVGMRQGFSRTYILLRDDSNESEKIAHQKKTTISTLAFMLLWGFLLTLVLQIFSKDISLYLLKNSQYDYLIKLSSLSALGLAFCQFFHSYLIIDYKLKYYFIFTSLLVITTLTLSIYLVAYKDLGVDGVIYASSISNVFYGSMSLLYMIKINFSKVSFMLILKMLRFGIPTMFGIMFLIAFDIIDRLFIKEFLGFTELGIYAVGRKISYIVSVSLTTPFMTIWTPFCLNLVKQDGHKVIISKIILFLISIFSMLSLCLSLFAPIVIPIITSYEYIGASDIIIWLTMCQTCYVTSTIFTTSILVNGKSEYGMYVNVFTLLIGIVFNFILIPNFGFLGASIATFLTFFLQSLLLYFISRKLYYIKYDVLKMVVLVFSTFIIYFVNKSTVSFFQLKSFPLYFFNIFSILSYFIICFSIVFPKGKSMKLIKEIQLMINA